MLAIVDLNGKQYHVEEGRYIHVDRLAMSENETLEIGNVMMVVDGEQSLVGAPFVDGATVKATVVSHMRGPKLLVYKMRCKKGYRRKNGHRQDYTKLQIDVVDFPGKADRPKQEKSEAAAPKKAKKAEGEDKPKKAAKASAADAAEKKPKAPKAPKAEALNDQPVPQAAEAAPEAPAASEE